jgi:UDP-galactopyranose mutase
MLPFARNESTRFISPTKTPEYLAAGLPTVSTSIRDVVTPYGDLDLVKIGDDAESFAAGIAAALSLRSPEWQKRVDGFLEKNSWETTWSQMSDLITSRERELIHV